MSEWMDGSVDGLVYRLLWCNILCKTVGTVREERTVLWALWEGAHASGWETSKGMMAEDPQLN